MKMKFSRQLPKKQPRLKIFRLRLKNFRLTYSFSNYHTISYIKTLTFKMIFEFGNEAALKIFEYALKSCTHSCTRNLWPLNSFMRRYFGVKSFGINCLNDLINCSSNCFVPSVVFKPSTVTVSLNGYGMKNAPISLKLDLNWSNDSFVSEDWLPLKDKSSSTVFWFCSPNSTSSGQSRTTNSNFWNAFVPDFSYTNRPYSVFKCCKSFSRIVFIILKHWTDESIMLIVKQALPRWSSKLPCVSSNTIATLSPFSKSCRKISDHIEIPVHSAFSPTFHSKL